MNLLQVSVTVSTRVRFSGTLFISAVTTMCVLFFALVAVQAQTAPTSIVVSPSNPFITTTQTQQFTALSGNTIELQGLVQISDGDLHTCALLGNGTVECWGDNQFGELGNGTNSGSDTPVPVSGLSGVTAITARGHHSCALLADGTVRCWGYNATGQLGNSSNIDSNIPVPVSGLSGATAISGGLDETCALLADGRLECWGGNSSGQLGNGTNADSNIPMTVSLPHGIIATAISAGDGHACALTAGGEVRCWGYNATGQLGNGSTDSSNTPVLVSLPVGTMATAVAAGGLHSCALLASGQMECWGYNTHGQLGDGTRTASDIPVTVMLPAGTEATAIATEFDHTCALLADGTVRCWGYNDFGQLGNGATTDSIIPAAVMLPFFATATAITTGEYHSCALLANGTAQCWGANGTNPFFSGTDTPVAVVGNAIPGMGADQISAGLGHSCALLADGTVQCWGWNQNGQLGNNSNTDSNTPVAVSGLSETKAIRAGGNHTCALLADGTVRCWGSNAYSALGSSSTSDSNIPLTVSGLSGATAIAAGGDNSCALLADGTVQCWGANDTGELGNGSNVVESNTPVAVSGLSGAMAITVGGSHTCAVLADGTVRCWGYNGHGELGNGSNTDSGTPVPVTLLTSMRVTAIAAGDVHTCALFGEGTVKCWGDNTDGQLGNGSNTNSNTPVTVSGLSTATAIAAGDVHSCALLADGKVKCWGFNGNSQLGNPSHAASNIPVLVSGLSRAIAIAGGGSHTCAVLADGTVRCWGNDGNGQLGNGLNTESSRPVATNALATNIAWSSGNTSVATIDPVSGLAIPFSATSTGTSLITATFGALTNSTTLTVGIAPQFTSGNATTFTTGTLGTFSVTTNMSAFPTPSISKSGSLPSGVNFVDNNNGTATLSGTPAANTGGLYPLTITASNGVAPDATQSFTLTVNQPPAITRANTATFTVGVPGTTFTVTASGYPHSFTFGVTGLPAGLSFNSSTGVLSGTPAVGTGGSYPLTFTASNGVTPSATQNFTLIIDEAPAITSTNSATFKVGAGGNFTVTTLGYPIPSISETGTLPAGVSLVDHGNRTATLGGTPQVAGTFHVVMKSHNGIGSDATQNFTLLVNKGDTTSRVSGPPSGFFSSGQAVTLTAVVSGGGVTPTGTVKFSTSTTQGYLLGTVSLSPTGVATLRIVLPNGTNYIHVDYSGDGNYSPSTSPTLVVRMY